MFYKMITAARDKWYNSPDCTIVSLIEYITKTAQLRDAQIEAIKTYLYLKIGCGNKPLAELFTDGRFNSLDLAELEISSSTRAFLEEHPAAAALYEYACMTNDVGEQISKKTEKVVRKEPESVDYEKFFNSVFYDVSYTDYLFSLPMGAGKTFLMAAFIYLDLYFALNEPKNPAFAHNFIIFAPSGLKSSVVPSLRTIQNFNPSWVIPEPAATELKRLLSFEVLDQNRTAKKSNKTKNPNVQKIASHQPLSDAFGLVAVTNAEKVIYECLEDEEMQLSLFSADEQAKIRQASELRSIIGQINNLSVFIDEVHHASAAGDSKLRKVVTEWTENDSFNSVIGFSGTPYLEKAEKIQVAGAESIGTTEISNIVYYYPLINGVGNFLKRPSVVIADIADSSRIIERGVRAFFDAYKDTVYFDGTTAKLGIYCGTIEKLEELVYPLVVRVASEYGIGSEAVLRFYRESSGKGKKYIAPADSQMEFDSLDKPFSKTRVVLLVQIGKEGWDCKSLTGIILSQEGDCPKNMVLQTSCRCLREVEKRHDETALIYLNKENADKLNSQLMQQQHISLREFSSVEKKEGVTLRRYDRTKFLKLPKIDFYQLKVNYETRTLETAAPDEKIPLAAEKAKKLVGTETLTDFTQAKLGIRFDDAERGNEAISFSAWLNGICKSSFGTLTIPALKAHEEKLKTVFETITYSKDGVHYFSSKFDRNTAEEEIRKAFCDRRDFTTLDELIPEKASLLNIANFKTEITTSAPSDYYPEQEMTEKIIQDDKGKLTGDKNTIKAIEALEISGIPANLEMAKILRSRLVSHPQKDRSFHYLPYHTDSSFEQTFLEDTLAFEEIRKLGLEVYYNGDRFLTEFKIKCFRKSGKNWDYIGMYTPDFLIIKRKDRKIHKAVIIETKGAAYEAQFESKKAFMESAFIEKNNAKFGYKCFDFLYLPDTLTEKERLTKTHEKISEFFEEGAHDAD